MAHASSSHVPIRYVVRIADARAHLVDVEATVPTGGRAQLELMMPVWAPGSYLIREFARQVEWAVASDPHGGSLVVERVAKNRWRVNTDGTDRVTFRYRLYAREMSVRTNWVDADFALLNGAATFVTLADGVARPHEVSLILPAGWLRSVTALPARPDAPHEYVAADFDTLVDSPIVAGNPRIREFAVDGVPHALVTVGGEGLFDEEVAARDLERVVREHRRMWRGLPYTRYLFLNLLTEGRGGLEHRDSCAIMASRWATRTRTAYLAWLELASHEFFHVWNAKRLRPVELGPFNYEAENYTRSLWVVEGITDYYGDLAVCRAGLSTTAEYLDHLSHQLETLQTTPGRLAQPVDRASMDTWIRFYRPDENSPNVSISYYVKGHVMAWLLDARIRQLTEGAASLEDVMRAAYADYAGERGFTLDQFHAVAERVAGVSLADFRAATETSLAELDYAPALATLGLRFARPAAPAAGAPVSAHLGISTRIDQGRLVVTGVTRGTAAYMAGVDADDELVGVDDYRIPVDGLADRLTQYRPGETVVLLVARRERLLRLPVTLAAAPTRMWTLEADPGASEEAVRERHAWLRPGGGATS